MKACEVFATIAREPTAAASNWPSVCRSWPPSEHPDLSPPTNSRSKRNEAFCRLPRREASAGTGASGEDRPRHRFRQKSCDLASVSELSNRSASGMSGNNACGKVPSSSNRVVHVQRLKVPSFFPKPNNGPSRDSCAQAQSPQREVIPSSQLCDLLRSGVLRLRFRRRLRGAEAGRTPRCVSNGCWLVARCLGARLVNQ